MEKRTKITLGVLVTFVAAAAAVFGRSPKAAAQTRVPMDATEVLEKVPGTAGDPRRQQEISLRAVLRQNPRNVHAATALARLEIQLARENADPRHLGRAQAALAPWWDEADAPVAILVLRATIAQSLHDFDRAVVDLDRAVKIEPRDGQAWVTRAVVLTVLARYDEARASCASGAPHMSELATIVCETQIDSVTGRARPAFARLSTFLFENTELPKEEAAWARSSLAEYALRLGEHATAEHLLGKVLEEDPEDTYARAALADLLLDTDRPVDAAKLVRGREANDTLLLRLAIAEKRAKTPFAADRADLLGARFDASRARGDVVHRREEARYWLEVRDDADKALELAKANWDVQKEPADARIFVESALAARSPASAEPVLAWLATTKLEDKAIDLAAGELHK